MILYFILINFTLTIYPAFIIIGRTLELELELEPKLSILDNIPLDEVELSPLQRPRLLALIPVQNLPATVL